MTDTPNSKLPIGDAPVPVFNCRVLVRKIDGTFHARVANLADITATEKSERDAIASVVKEFKATIEKHIRANESPPWLEPELVAEEGEQERWIPVHL